MLAAQICRELRLGGLASRMPSRVPRCLFGPPSSRDTVELLQEALDVERARFARRWGVDPLAAEDDDKENAGPRQASPRKHSSRASPYAKQTSIHDYWRSRKVYDPSNPSKKSSSSAFADVTRLQQQLQAQAQPQQPQNPTDKVQSKTN